MGSVPSLSCTMQRTRTRRPAVHTLMRNLASRLDGLAQQCAGTHIIIMEGDAIPVATFPRKILQLSERFEPGGFLLAWVLHERAAEPHQGAGLGERCGAWPALSRRLHEGVCAPRLRLPDVHASEGVHPSDVQADARVALSAWYRSLVLHGVSATWRSISPHALRSVLVRVRACMLLSAVRIVIRKLLPRPQGTFAFEVFGLRETSPILGQWFHMSSLKWSA